MARNLTPTAKVTAGGLTGAATIVLIAVCQAAGVNLDPVVAAAVITLLSFGVSYAKPETRPTENP